MSLKSTNRDAGQKYTAKNRPCLRFQTVTNTLSHEHDHRQHVLDRCPDQRSLEDADTETTSSRNLRVLPLRFYKGEETQSK